MSKQQALDKLENSQEVYTKWQKTSVQELVDKGIIEKPMDGNHGSNHPTKEDYVEDGIPFIMAKNIKDGKIDLEDCKKLPKEFTEDLRKGFAERGDVLLSHKGTLGRTAVVEEINDDYIMLSPQITYYRVLDPNQLNNHYLKYFFDSHLFQQTLNNWAGGGSTRPYLGITDQRNLPVVLPPKDVQDKIVSILKPLDQKTRTNNRINEILGEMAQTLFESWFVDFEIYDGQMTYDEDMGREIPKTWAKKSLEDIANFLNGKAWQDFESDQEKNKLPVIKIKELRNGITEDSDKVKKSKCPEEYIIKEGTVLFSWSASLVLTLWTDEEGFLNQHLFKVTSDNYPRWLYYEWINYYINEFRKIAEAKKTTMGHIKRSDLKEAKVLVPPEEELEALSDIMDPIFESLVERSGENNTLSNLRDTMLPMLMTGEIEVDDIDR